MSAGTKTALIDVYLAKREALARFLVARFRDENIAEDILQEMYLKIDRSNFDKPIENMGAFLYRMANNLALDFRKQVMRQQARDKNWGDASSHQISGEPVDDTVDVTVAIDAKKKLDRIVAAVEELSPQCRRVFIAHKFEGLSHSEVAARLNVSRGTVEKHMSKALKYLVQHLKGID